MNLPYHLVPKEFNPNAFWYEFFQDHWYDTSNSKGTVFRNPCIQVAKRLLACGLFSREDSLNVPRQSELHVLYSMLQGDRLDPGSSLVNQLYREATSSTSRIVIGGLITPLLGL